MEAKIVPKKKIASARGNCFQGCDMKQKVSVVSAGGTTLALTNPKHVDEVTDSNQYAAINPSLAYEATQRRCTKRENEFLRQQRSV